MHRLLHIALVVSILMLGAFGISRLNYNVDIVKLLPRHLPGTEGTTLFQSLFDKPDQLIITLHSPSGSDLSDAAAELADHLQNREGLVKRVNFEPAWLADPSIFVHLSAHALLNAPEEEFQRLLTSLAPENLDATLKSTMGALSRSMDPMTTALASRDPLGLSAPMLAGMGSPGSQDGLAVSDGYATPDGAFRLLKVDAPTIPASYKESALWLDKIRTVAESWRLEHENSLGPISIGYTGTPAFAAEIGSGMEQDMSQSVSGITLIVGFLFWLLHRRIGPLFLLLTAMLASGLITLGLAGLIFGSLNVMSMGFAAILMGMIEDFGVMGLHESMHRPGARFREIHAKVFPAIAWSAVATSAVFASLFLSTLPGISQMGILTSLGILVGAVVMLYGFLPLAMRWTKPGGAVGAEIKPELPPARWPAWLAAGLALACSAGILVRGLPGVMDSSGLLRPKHCQAYDTLMLLEKNLQPVRTDEISLPIVLKADSAEALSATVKQTATLLDQAVADGASLGYTLPTRLVPDSARQAANLPRLARLSADRDRLLQAMDKAGFNREGFRFAAAVLDACDSMQPATPNQPIWPDTGKVTDMMGPVLHQTGTSSIACGFIRIPAGPNAFDSPLIQRLQTLPNVHPAGWDFLSSQIKKLLAGEVQRVLLPAAVVLAILFFFVFKNGRERLLATASLGFSGFILLGMMSWFAIPWNFVNIGAVPLCLGLGLDFNIHMIYALRDTRQTSPGIGRALAYCGLSTGLGFGALAFSDNVGLSSFGLTAMIGVLATLFTAAFFLPWAWRALEFRRAPSPHAG